MPISPTVSAWMENMNQPAPAGDTSEQLFRKTFTDQAFASLRAKYPTLINFIVTFKIFDSDIDKGDAFGAFAITYGRSVMYIPVVMSAGSIVSCEMAYIRDEDQFTPLIPEFVKNVVGKNTATPAKIMNGNVRVEDTKTMFRNLIRPPSSSNVIIASSMGVESLPNAYKEVVADYLEGHPALLAKIAEYYPVELLAEKLASVPEEEIPAPVPEIISIEDLTKEAASCLSREEQARLLGHGYIVKDAGLEEANMVLDLSKYAEFVEGEGFFTEYPFGDVELDARYRWRDGMRKRDAERTVFKGDIVSVNPAHGVEYTPSIFVADLFIYGNRAYQELSFSLYTDKGSHVVVRDISDEVSRGDLSDMGFVPVERLKSVLSMVKDPAAILCVVPLRRGGWQKTVILPVRQDMAIMETDDGYIIKVPYVSREGDKQVLVTKGLTYGAVKADNEEDIFVPDTAMFWVKPRVSKELPVSGIIHSFEGLRKYMSAMGTPLKVETENGAVHITNKQTEKTASFSSEADAARYLQDTFALTGDQIGQVFEYGEPLIMSKTAFDGEGDQNQVPVQPMPDQGQQMPMPMQQAQPMAMQQGTMEMPAQPMFDPNNLDAFASIGDEQVLDTGVLASFGNDPDIKALLVDYLPDFVTVLDRMGRVLLLFNLNKEDIENYYGTEKLSDLLGNCRKVFKTVGELVYSLKKYINMA